MTTETPKRSLQLMFDDLMEHNACDRIVSDAEDAVLLLNYSMSKGTASKASGRAGDARDDRPAVRLRPAC